MGYLDNIDKAYAEHERMANAFAGKDAAQQHAAHKVMQQLVADRDAYNSRNSSAAPSSSSSPPPPPPASPPPPPPPPGQKQTSQVKISAVNVINRNYEDISVQQMERLYFQNVGGTEILSVARHDTVGGEEVVFNNVDNLSELRSQFNPLNILMTTNINSLFSEYGVDIGQKIGALDETFSMNVDGGIDIQVFNVNRDEYVQVQIAKRVGEEEFGLGTMWYNRSEDK